MTDTEKLELEQELAASREETRLATELGWSALQAMKRQRDKAAALAWYEGFDAVAEYVDGNISGSRSNNPYDLTCTWFWV